LADLPQEYLIGPQLAVFLRVGHDGPHDLGAEQLAVFALGEAGQVHPLGPGREAALIAAGSDLLQLDHLLTLVRVDHPQLAVEEVAALAVGLGALPGDAPLPVPPVPGGRGVARAAGREDPRHGLGPELVEVPPA